MPEASKEPPAEKPRGVKETIVGKKKVQIELDDSDPSPQSTRSSRSGAKT